MARKLRTKAGKAAYSRRKRLLAACHKLRKIFRHAGTAGLATVVS